MDPARKGQEPWVAARLAALGPGRTVTVAEMAPAYAERFGFTDPAQAVDRLSIILGKLRREPRDGIALVYLRQSTYRIEAAAAPAAAAGAPA